MIVVGIMSPICKQSGHDPFFPWINRAFFLFSYKEEGTKTILAQPRVELGTFALLTRQAIQNQEDGGV